MNHIELLFLALVLDAILGEPDWIWSKIPHPATIMGRGVDWFDSRLNQGKGRKITGTITIILLVIAALAIGFLVQIFPDYGLLEALIAATLLAQRSLVQHVKDVATALRQGISEGRSAVSLIVGRDPEHLDESAIARSAIESAAENFSDGVIAPAFWFLIFGLPGILVYKLVNTADSMIGHRNEKYYDFGWAAARLDDLLNWVPARLTGGLICLVYWSKSAWNVMLTDADLHRSPNAGWPEAATAGVLGIALAGPRSYNGTMTDFLWVNSTARREIGPDDIEKSIQVLWRSWFAVVWILAILVIFTIKIL